MTDFKLKYQIIADAAKAKAEVRSFDDLLEGVGGRIGGLGSGAALATAGVATIAAGATAAGVALFNLTKNAADFGSEIFDASKKTGLHAESLSAMKFAADQSGTSLEAITGGIAKFSKTVGDAADGSKEAAAKLKAFGIEPQEAINDLDGTLGKVFKRIVDAPPGIERMTLAQKAFGKSGADLLPFLDSFDGDLGKLIKKAKELGVTIDDEAARAADEFGDQLDTLNAQFSAVGRTIGQAFMPVFLEMAEGVSGFVTRNKDDIARWGQQTADTLLGLIGYWNDYHKAVAGGSRYAINAAGEREYLGEAMWGGALGLLLRDRGTRQRMDQAGSAWQPGQFGLDPRTFTLGALPTPSTPPRSTGGGSGAGGGGRRASSGDNRTDKQVYLDFVKALKEEGVFIGKGQGFRTYEEQQKLFNMLPRGQAARPGTSDHEFYRGLDLPADVSDELVERAARKAGVVLGKKLIHQGTGRHRHQPFRKGQFSGGGEADAFAEAENERRFLEEEQTLIREGLKDAAADMIRRDEEASANRLAIRQKEADLALVMIEDMVSRGEMSEIEAMRRVGELKIDMLIEEQSELESQIPTEKTIQRLQELKLEIQQQSIQNAKDEHDYWKKIGDEIERQNRSLQKRNARPTGLKTRKGPGEGGGFLDELYNATGGVKDMGDVWEQVGQQATDAFMQMGQGLGSMLGSWVMLGDQADVSMQKMVAATLAGVATQAATLSIFHLAMGIAALTPWGAAMYGPAPLHFKAAALWGGIALGTAVLGRAAAGDSNQSGGRGGSSGSSSASSGSSGTNNRDLRPISRVSDNAYISGQEPVARFVAQAIDKLTKKISGVNAGDILVAGSRQRKGFIGNQVADDMKRNPMLGSTMLRRANAR